MEQKNRINKAGKSVATDFHYGFSSATDMKKGMPLAKPEMDSNIALNCPVQKGHVTNPRPRVSEYDFSARRREAAAKARLKVMELEKEISHLKSTNGSREEIAKLETGLEHQRRIIERCDQHSVNGVRDTLSSMRLYVDSKEQASDYADIASKHAELARMYAQNAQISQNKAVSATNTREISKYQRESEKLSELSKKERGRARKWEEKSKSVAGRKQSIPGKVREKVRNFQKSNAISRASRSLSEKAGKAFSKAGKGLVDGLSGLLSTGIGKAVAVFMITLAILVSSIGNFTYYVQAQEIDKSDEAYIEYSVWMDFYNDEGERFYKDYHAVVSSAYLVPITYTYYNQGVYQRLLNGWMEEHPYQSYGKPRSEYLADAYKYAIETYFGSDLDAYQLRELFLDRVEYQYQYLAREYSEWTEGLEEGEGYDEIQSYEREIRVEDYGYVEHSHLMSEEECRSSYSGSSAVASCIANPPQVSEGATYEKTGEHIEMKTFYRGRNVTNQYWTLSLDESNVDHDIHRTIVPDGYTQITVPDLPTYPNGGYSPDYQENIGDHDSYWTYMYAENGAFVKRIRYWLLRNQEDVYQDIAYQYYPGNENERVLVLYKEDPVIGEIEFEIDRRYIYNVYFAKDQTGIFRENVFLDEHNLEYYQQMTFLYETFMKLFSVSGIQFAEGKFLLSPFFTAGLDAQSHITQHFAQIGVGNRGGQHGALDFGFPSGTPINVMVDGTVATIRENIPENTSGYCATSPNSAGCHGSIGNEVEIESRIIGADGAEHVVRLRYYHILGGSATDAGIHVGDSVSAGQVIAKVGHNGLSTGAHLHLAMTIDGEKVDPEPYIQF